jgi:hypothetical protein
VAIPHPLLRLVVVVFPGVVRMVDSAVALLLAGLAAVALLPAGLAAVDLLPEG